MFTIREANLDDIAQIAPLFLADLQEQGFRNIDLTYAENEVFDLMAKHDDFWLACGDNPVGYANGWLDDREIYRIHTVYVAPSSRKKGIGTALQQALITYAAQMGAWKVMGWVSKENEASIRMQRSLHMEFFDCKNDQWNVHCELGSQSTYSPR